MTIMTTENLAIKPFHELQALDEIKAFVKKGIASNNLYYNRYIDIKHDYDKLYEEYEILKIMYLDLLNQTNTEITYDY